ncbi:hypothetical protein KRE40_15145 [Elizabethkingia meningoseptica]|uniref:hypothetical protein n=1 Tax=Elizabethkingia meningoseptica TaxID=238 RepID=UPI0023B01828|nr:hypothetical protein [Elizabethkingia meningoseptica]MDE5439423.1 hypothetical protein [Elizabethkingia meningoseptica]MDE5509978.1 hypothetical protein [Elizabethkingia meningoseptica]MDE5517118.1 hypothetical protein [Elizabethkingia meningoseptica]MDE5527723.1 hypothetical protein [Elizabethkingia meningoseptica]MDE5531358.1 hypothetical protein [Elizabethkingia meningoseptica]
MENQDQKITTYLVDKKLPLDILLEVKDHMSDQVSALKSEKGLSFDEAFEQTKISWEQDLKMGFSFFSYKFRKITRLQHKITMQQQFRIQKKSILIMFAIFLVVSYSVLYTPEISTYIFVTINAIVALFGIVVSVYDRKLMKTTQNNYKKNISIFQRSTGESMLVGAFFIIMNNVLEPESRLADIGEGLKTIFIQHHFTFKALILTTINYFLIYMVVYSLFNYLNYKKAIARIKERMVLEF